MTRPDRHGKWWRQRDAIKAEARDLSARLDHEQARREEAAGGRLDWLDKAMFRLDDRILETPARTVAGALVQLELVIEDAEDSACTADRHGTALRAVQAVLRGVDRAQA